MSDLVSIFDSVPSWHPLVVCLPAPCPRKEGTCKYRRGMTQHEGHRRRTHTRNCDQSPLPAQRLFSPWRLLVEPSSFNDIGCRNWTDMVRPASINRRSCKGWPVWGQAEPIGICRGRKNLLQGRMTLNRPTWILRASKAMEPCQECAEINRLSAGCVGNCHLNGAFHRNEAGGLSGGSRKQKHVFTPLRLLNFQPTCAFPAGPICRGCAKEEGLVLLRIIMCRGNTLNPSSEA